MSVQGECAIYFNVLCFAPSFQPEFPASQSNRKLKQFVRLLRLIWERGPFPDIQLANIVLAKSKKKVSLDLPFK